MKPRLTAIGVCYTDHAAPSTAQKLIVNSQTIGGYSGIIGEMFVDNIKVDLGELGLGGVDWTGLAQEKESVGFL
jgi:hypothetical protein